MNWENLHTLIDRYEDNYYMINGSDKDHNETFKWGAVRGFRDVWFSEEASSMPFSKLFDAAMKRSSVMINNSMISPTVRIVKMAEMVVRALKEYASLLEKYETLFKNDDRYYYDESLHLMAFDLMYCCRCYNFYGDMKYAKKTEAAKRAAIVGGMIRSAMYVVQIKNEPIERRRCGSCI